MATSSGPTLYRGDVAPVTGRAGDLWVNTADAPPTIHICEDSTPTWTAIGGGMTPTITTYTTGSDTFIPSVDQALCRVTLVGGGGGSGGVSASGTSGGGGGGATVVAWLRVPIAGFSYSIGAGGTAGLSSGTAGGTGGFSSFGPLTAKGGFGSAGSGGGTGTGGAGGGANSGSSTTGGGGGNGSCGGAPAGDPTVPTSGTDNGGGISYSSRGGGGGSSIWGKGASPINAANQPGVSPASTEYGAGAAGANRTTVSQAGAAGASGFIMIEDYGTF